MANMNDHSEYQSALCSRYSSREILQLFSEENKVLLWRQLWVWLAETEMELGLHSIISEEQIEQMKGKMHDIDWQFVKNAEKQTRHDVMAHIHAFEAVAPKAKGIIHLGATSAFVQDNADLIIIKNAASHVLQKCAHCIYRLSRFALKYRDMPTVGRTHYQAATITTLGKRASIWTQDLLISFQNLDSSLKNLRFRGVQGATGSLASFMTLFNGDKVKLNSLNAKLASLAGFSSSDHDPTFIITGQTYTRLVDISFLNSLAMLAASVHKICMDIRMLQCFGELQEPFEKTQVGSSAMPYKKNPMRSERCCGLSRYLMNLPANALQTFAVQGFERTLDDSSNRRLVLPEAFITADAILNVFQNIAEGLIVHENVIRKNVMKELPFLTLETVLMKLTLGGADRQVAHEKIRQIALHAAENEKDGKDFDLYAALRQDTYFENVHAVVDSLRDPRNFIGMCKEQVQKIDICYSKYMFICSIPIRFHVIMMCFAANYIF
ncbi:unnamed protein product [Soboliphyme baturini]|uniref:Adenylosuccinate lyase n=1 Tax=Soboliphyme baturini TaxID=241478 RepID=A0A183IKY5_9BILA|nr:unnamed protein product [Soboliphyme baturini]